MDTKFAKDACCQEKKKSGAGIDAVPYATKPGRRCKVNLFEISQLEPSISESGLPPKKRLLSCLLAYGFVPVRAGYRIVH